MIRLAILQRVCPPYRLPLFAALSQHPELETQLLIGDDLPESKVKSAPDLSGVRVTRLETCFYTLGRRTLPVHIGLVAKLKSFEPDVILCEGESHFLGYLQALYYQAVHRRQVALLHWCFTTLPGVDNNRRDFAGRVKEFFRPFFSAFVVYSSYSRQCLLERGIAPEKIFVATNVGAVSDLARQSESITETKSELRMSLGLAEKFTVLFAGTLDTNKRPEVLLDLARVTDATNFNFVIVGTGPHLPQLESRAASEALSNVHFVGRVGSALARYYRAADVLLVPGRGGIVMTEAMACGLPVIVHQADGTESDLVDPGVTGLRVERGDTSSFVEAVELLRNNSTLCKEMGVHGKNLISTQYSESNMVERILAAARYAKEARLRDTGEAPAAR